MPPKKTTLANGITIMTESMPQVRSISMGLWYNVGSRDERIDQAGLTHFMEHMMFKGTPTRTAVEISSQFDAIGADLNAFTSKEYTCYHARFVDEKLKEAMPIFADMVINSSFSNDTIDLLKRLLCRVPEEVLSDDLRGHRFLIHSIEAQARHDANLV